VEIVAEVANGWPRATAVVARRFRADRVVGELERGLVVERAYACIRQHRRLAAIAEEVLPGAATAPPQRQAALRLALLELRQGVALAELHADLKRLLGGGVDATRLTADDAGLGPTSGLEREAIRLSLPTWLLEHLIGELGRDDATAFAAASNRHAPITLRANRARISREDLAAQLAAEGVPTHPATLARDGLVLERGARVFGLEAFRAGLFEVMDEGSQLVAETVAPPPRGRVLDACAGAGGKTLALAGLLSGRGRVVASDRDPRRLEALRQRAARADLSNIVARALGENDALPAEVSAGGFDRVLVDAPCSGLGVLRRHPEARWRLRAEQLQRLPAQQLALLTRYAPLCAIGGRLIHATCSVLPSENEAVVAHFLAEQPGFERVLLKEILGRERALALGDGACLRVAPHSHGCDGLFAAVLRRRA
jgi:16S rRNA (cytosine967-C5)-methyltransferase